MTPIGSASSNIRRAIEFMADPSFCNLGAPSGRSRSVGLLRTAKLIAQRSHRGQVSQDMRANRLRRGGWGQAPVRRSVELSDSDAFTCENTRMRLMRHVVVFDAADLAAESSFWA